MGVKDLWPVLAPVCERKPLWYLQGKTVAIDLSCWVCDSQTLTTASAQPRMYLRNLFFRTSYLLLLGVKPVFVLEGLAPALKHGVMSRRNELQYGKKCSQSKKGGRSHFSLLLNQCKELLSIMGLTCIQGNGEAEAFCALLNSKGVTDGCISQDSDCFLYGARTVYRNFSVGSRGAGIDIYEMSVVEKKLSLTRRKMIALSLLCGCDYNEKGVAGIGKEHALRFLENTEDDEVLDRLNNWRHNPYYEQLDKERAILKKEICADCLHLGTKKKHDKNGCTDCESKSGCRKEVIPCVLQNMDLDKQNKILAELTVRAKAIQDPEFPHLQIIEEFLQNDDVNVPHQFNFEWKQPDLIKFISFAVKMLSWAEIYSLEKFLPLLSRWQLLNPHQPAARDLKAYLLPQKIVKKRVARTVASYEVEWKLIGCDCNTDELPGVPITVEPSELVTSAYPSLVDCFNKLKEEKSKKGKRQERKKKVPKEAKEKVSPDQLLMDYFIKSEENDKTTPQVTYGNVSTSERLTSRSGLNKKSGPKKRAVVSQEFTASVKNSSMRENSSCDEQYMDVSMCANHEPYENCSFCDDTDDLDLTLIIEGIIGTKLDDTAYESDTLVPKSESEEEEEEKCCNENILPGNNEVNCDSRQSVIRYSECWPLTNSANFSLGANALLETTESSFVDNC